MSTYSTFAGSGGGGATSGGETITCNGSTISLTSDNSSSLSLCFNQTGCVCLPNATTLDEGSALYTIKNLSTENSVLLHDHCCNLYNFIKPFESIQISLHDNSTAQGGWTFQKPLTNLENLAIDSNYSFPTGFTRGGMDQVATEGTYGADNGIGDSDAGHYFLGVQGNCVFTGFAKYNTTSKSYEPMSVQKCCITGETSLCIKSFTSFYHGGAVGFLCSGQHVGISCTGTACLYCENDTTWCTSCLCNRNNNTYGYVTDCLSTFATMLPKVGENACQKLRLMHICAVTGAITCLCEVTDTMTNELLAGNANQSRVSPVFELTRHYHHFFGTKTCRITSIKWLHGAVRSDGTQTCINSECVWIYVPCYQVSGTLHFSAFNPCALNGTNLNGQHMAPYTITSSASCRNLTSFVEPCRSGTLTFSGDPCRFIYQYRYCNSNNDEAFFAKIVQYTGSAFCSEYICPSYTKQCRGFESNSSDNSMSFALVHDCFLYVQRVQNNCAPNFRSACGGELIHLCWGTSPCACTKCTGICCTSAQHCGAAQCDLWNNYLRQFSHRQYGRSVSSDTNRENGYIRLCNPMFYKCVDATTGKSTRPNCVHYFNAIFASCGNKSGYFSGMNIAYRCDECGFCIFYPRCRDGSTARWNYMCGCGTAMARLMCCYVDACCWHANPQCCCVYEGYTGGNGNPDNRAVVLQFTPGTSGQTAQVDVVKNLHGYTFCVVGGAHTCDGKGWGLSHGSAGCSCGFCDLQWIDCCNEHFIQGSIQNNSYKIGLAKICRDSNYCIKHCDHICIRENCCFCVSVNDSKCFCHENIYPFELTSPTTGFIMSHSHPCGGFNSSLALHTWTYDSSANVYKMKTSTVYRLEDTFVCNLLKGACIDQTNFSIITCQSSGATRDLKSYAFYDACR